MNLIRLLPDTLTNQIAAGEVVQRPASVVKELIENAIDAGSTDIKIVIKEAGKTLIQIIDNGQGMSETDACMSFEKHATSKISTAADLFNIRTMGFRGEALASISAVAQMEMSTCTKAGALGTQIVIEGSVVQLQQPIATEKGTKISVKNLFFNIPARRNFLKSNPVETKHIIDEFQRTALARPDIAFALYQNNATTYQLPPAKLSHRIVHLFGETHKSQLVPCEEATDFLKIHGYIGKPTYAKKTRGEQFFFVNQRFIKSSYLHHAVKSTFEGLLPQDAFPFYVLFIDIPPARIDANIHPTKTEIKFDEERTVYAILQAAVKKALAVYHVTPSLDFDQDVNFSPFGLKTKPTPGSTITEKNYAQFKQLYERKSGDWEKLFSLLESHGPQPGDTPPTVITMPSVANQLKHTAKTQGALMQASAMPMIQIHGQYLFAQIKSGAVFIDQEAAHERILYEKYSHALQNKAIASQQYLFAHTVTLHPGDFALVQDCAKDIRTLGFSFEIGKKNTITVSGYPADTLIHEPQGLFEGLIEQFKCHQAQLSLSSHENWARALAKRACIPVGKKLNATEMDSLVNQLFTCQQPQYTSDGHLVFIMLTLEKIAALFQG